MSFDWKKQFPTVEITVSNRSLQALEAHVAFDALHDLNDRLSNLEKMGEEAQEAIDGGCKDELREAMLAGYRLSTYAASIHWNGSENSLDWLRGLKMHIMDVQEKCLSLEPDLETSMKTRADIPDPGAGGQGGAAHPDSLPHKEPPNVCVCGSTESDYLDVLKEWKCSKCGRPVQAPVAGGQGGAAYPDPDPDPEEM